MSSIKYDVLFDEKYAQLMSAVDKCKIYRAR
jgi:hypothetical protein